MFLNNLIIFFLLGLCLGDKRETLSSISFLRDDVPLSYSSLNDYLTEKSRKRNDQLIDYFRHRPNMLKSIQYAPLKPEETSLHHSDINNPTARHIENKVHLEPRVIENSKYEYEATQANFLQYIEGHNIVPIKRHKDNGNVPHLLSEKNKEMDQIENKVYPEPQKDVVSLQATTKENAGIDVKNQQTLSTKGYPTKSYHVLSALENSQIEPVLNSYVKVPRLHLNIARAYNFARLPFKAAVMGYPKQTFVPNIDVLLHQKTFLYPVHNNKFTLRS